MLSKDGIKTLTIQHAFNTRYLLCVQMTIKTKITPGKRKREEDEHIFEQRENAANPSRCPVKIFECYLAKCPPDLQQRSDLFYLQPDHSSAPDSPIWFSSIPLDRNVLENMLVRILVIKDIYEENEKDSSEVDEDDVD